MSSLKNNSFWVKLSNWEYWPWYIVYMPIFAYWLWCGLKARAIFYISAANPGFEYGGIIGASKNDILEKLPQNLVPSMFLIETDDGLEKVLERIKKAGLSFPVIAKPNIGERGFMVELINNETELEAYLNNSKGKVIIQEYVDMPFEAGVFYCRMPNQENGVVTSIVIKELLKISGDGTLSIMELMKASIRARFQIHRMMVSGHIDLSRVPDTNEEVLLEPIGNHVRGTMFIDGCHLINQQLTEIFDGIAKNIDGFYYGRFDLRCADESALYRGDFKILELNGAASEPAHIYSPNFPIREAYKVLFKHWRVLYDICKINHQRGIPYMSFSTGITALRKSRFAR